MIVSSGDISICDTVLKRVYYEREIKMKANKSIIFALLTIICSLVLMNLANVSDKVPDSFIHVFGIISLIGAGLCIFFTVRSACTLKEENKERNDTK